MTHIFFTRTSLCIILTLSIALIGGLIIGCQSEEKSASLSGPALSLDEAGAKRTEFNKNNSAQYTPGTVPGIAVTMDFTEYHRDGQPYGEWWMHASWRACRKGCPELVTADIPVTIDAGGQGSALIPPDFLNEVFQLAQQKYEEGKDDLGIWWNDKALVLDLVGSGSFRDSYNVDLGEEGYTYALSAGGVAGGMQQLLKALGISWWPGKAGDLPQDLAVATSIGQCIGVTETPPAPAVDGVSAVTGCDALCAMDFPGTVAVVIATGYGDFIDVQTNGVQPWSAPGCGTYAADPTYVTIGFCNVGAAQSRLINVVRSRDGCKTRDTIFASLVGPGEDRRLRYSTGSDPTLVVCE